MGGHCLRAQTTQAAPALSSTEAEYVASVRGGSVALGMRSIAHDLGDTSTTIRLRTDSAGNLGMTARKGLGRNVRHLDCALLWLQYHVDGKRIRMEKVAGIDNLADVGTKALDGKRLLLLSSLTGWTEAPGRHPRALRAAGVEGLGGYGLPAAVPAGDDDGDEVFDISGCSCSVCVLHRLDRDRVPFLSRLPGTLK